MKKFIGFVLGAAVLVAPAVAGAAVNVDSVYFNGQANITRSGGSTVNMKTYIVNDNSNDIECVRVEFSPSGFVDPGVNTFDVQDQVNASPTIGWPFDLNVTLPSQAGTYDVTVYSYGTDGEAADNTCSTTADDSTTFTGRVIINSNSSDTGSTGSSFLTPPAWFTNWLASWSGNTGSAPAENTQKCDLIKPYLGAPQNTYSSLGVQLQSALLLDNPFSIPALKPGSTVPMGYRGPQTAAALAAYNAANNCN